MLEFQQAFVKYDADFEYGAELPEIFLKWVMVIHRVWSGRFIFVLVVIVFIFGSPLLAKDSVYLIHQGSILCTFFSCVKSAFQDVHRSFLSLVSQNCTRRYLITIAPLIIQHSCCNTGVEIHSSQTMTRLELWCRIREGVFMAALPLMFVYELAVLAIYLHQEGYPGSSPAKGKIRGESLEDLITCPVMYFVWFYVWFS